MIQRIDTHDECLSADEMLALGHEVARCSAKGIREAIELHARLGQSLPIIENGKIVLVSAKQLLAEAEGK